MDIRKLILNKLEKKGSFKSSEIIAETKLSRTYTNRILRQLISEGKIISIGQTNKTVYTLANKKNIEKVKSSITTFKKIYLNKNLQEDLVLAEIKNHTGIFFKLKDKIIKILDFSFTEMLNNAIEHSNSQKIEINFVKYADAVKFTIKDFGIGIFNNIAKKNNLPDTLTAIQELLKGKVTTDTKRHTGQGIFFTSKLADVFFITSSNKTINVYNILDKKTVDELFITNSARNPHGTLINFMINPNSNKDIAKIFSKHTNINTFAFDKTKIHVELYKIGKTFISRSEAKRLLVGLEKFKEIIFDFKNVDTVGQGFADEIFRVWQKNHQDISIKYENANENTEFMIKRSIV